MDFESDMFPKGMRVLVVDDNPACLRILERLLLKCNFNVTVANQAVMALKMLRENKEKFDIVISDVHMPGMDGFKLLEHIGLELDLPVIMLSANDDPKLVMKGIRHGAVDYLLKPVRIEDLKNIWQHVVRKKRLNQQKVKAGEDGPLPLLANANGNLSQEETAARKRKEYDSTTGDGGGDGDGDDDEYRNDSSDSATQKKARMIWSTELHNKFVAAVGELGLDKAFPKKILDVMNVDGLTRENVASHLQKYRLYIKKMSSSANKPEDETFNPFRLHESSTYPSGRSLLNPYGAFCSLESGLGKSSVATTPLPYHAGFQPGLSNTLSSFSKCLAPNQALGMNMNHFRHHNNSLYLQTSRLATPLGAAVPTLLDYSKSMENWKSGTSSRSTPQNDPLSSFNARNASYSTVDLQIWQGHKEGFNNISSAYNNLLVPVIDSSSQSFGQNYSLKYNNSLGDSSFGGSNLVQNTSVHESDADALMRLEDSYLLEDSELLAAGFTQDNCGTLDDIVSALLK